MRKGKLGDWIKKVGRDGVLTARVIKSRIRLTYGAEPLSYLWGYDRGLPIHRFYLNVFLREFSQHIRGHCLEFNDPCYTKRFGNSSVEKLDILHIDDTNPDATIIADLTKPNDIPDDTFDCIICTHVLHVVTEPLKAVGEMHRILKPGGVLLVAVPQVSMCDPKFQELWRFTKEGLLLILSGAFQAANIEVRAYGNSLTSAGEIRGLVSHEFSDTTLTLHDPRFAVEVCGMARKS